MQIYLYNRNNHNVLCGVYQSSAKTVLEHGTDKELYLREKLAESGLEPGSAQYDAGWTRLSTEVYVLQANETCIPCPEPSGIHKAVCYNPVTRTWDAEIPDYRYLKSYRKSDSRIMRIINEPGEIQQDETLTAPPNDSDSFVMESGEWVAANKIFSKLQIRRACRSLNLETKLDLLLGNEIFRKDWNDAQEIDLSDPVLLQALEAGNWSTDEIQSILHQMNTTTGA